MLASRRRHRQLHAASSTRLGACSAPLVLATRNAGKLASCAALPPTG
jgi:hypothetical protein